MGLSSRVRGGLGRTSVRAIFSSRFYGSIFVVAGILSGSYVWFWGTISKELPGTSVVIPSGKVKSLWFSRGGDLFVVESFPQQEDRLRRYRLPKGGWEAVSDVPIDLNLYARSCGLPGSATNSVVPYDISRDGQGIAFGFGDSVCVVSLGGRHSLIGKTSLMRKGKVVSVRFSEIGIGAVLAVFENGDIRFYNYKPPGISEAGSRLNGGEPPFSVFSSQQATIVASLVSGKLVCLEKGNDGRLRAPTLDVASSANVLIIAAIDCRKIVVGESDGNILSIETDRGKRFMRGPYYVAQGGVRALAFDGKDNLYAGGEFGSIRLLKKNSYPLDFMSVAPGVRLLAVGGRKLAYANSSLQVVDIETEREINGRGTYFISIAGLFLGILGILVSVPSFLSRFKKVN